MFKAHRHAYHSTLGWRVIKRKKHEGLERAFQPQRSVCGYQSLPVLYAVCFRIQRLEFRVEGLRSRVYGLGFGVQGSGFRVWGLGFGVYGLWFMVYGLWFMVYGSGFMV